MNSQRIIGLVLLLAGIGLWSGLACGATSLAMLYTSKIGKVRGRDRLLDRLPWRGDEQVLDVGCGRGLLQRLRGEEPTRGVDELGRGPAP